MKKIALGILAHVDAGKTTLSEALLYETGSIRSAGRVDHGDTHLDTNEIERERGITIFTSMAQFLYAPEGISSGTTENAPDIKAEKGTGTSNPGISVTLLDTPGHVDFSAETERTLQVLDYALLLISGTDGVQGHTRTLWKLLERYQVPTLLFVNKMDIAIKSPAELMAELKTQLVPACTDFTEETEEWEEDCASSDEALLEDYLENAVLDRPAVRRAIARRKLYPVLFGSALKADGITELLNILEKWTLPYEELFQIRYPDADPEKFGARVYKIGRGKAGERLSFLKIMSGSLRTKDSIEYRIQDGTAFAEKADQIRLCEGDHFENASSAFPGDITIVTGLSATRPGMGLGAFAGETEPVLAAVMTRALILPPDVAAAPFYRKIKELEEEDPALHLVWNEKAGEIRAQIMGNVQIEVLTRVIAERFGVNVKFGPEQIIYKETIARPALGIGHFEPLRHYAEVQLLLVPGGRGSGVSADSAVSEDVLALNWQRLITTHILEREHVGVLTGSALTDVKVMILTGRAHVKHTEGGDFRQATYRAIRQALMGAENVLLEPFYSFRLAIPAETVGRAMTDLSAKNAAFAPPEMSPDGTEALITGRAPVFALGDYAADVAAYTKGRGSLSLTPDGYGPCSRAEEVIAEIGYDPDADTENPSASVFCAHGAGFLVPWDEVPSYAHTETPGGGILQNFPGGISGMDFAGRGDEDPEGEDIFREHGETPEAYHAAVHKKKEDGDVLPEDDPELQAIYARQFGMNTDGIRQDAVETARRGWNRRPQAAPGGSGTGGARAPEGSGTGGAGGLKYRKRSDENASQVKKDKKGNPIYPKKDERPEYMIVDGYNIIFQWPDLSALARESIDAARGRLLDILSNYQGYTGLKMTVVFDAYRTDRTPEAIMSYDNLEVVFTRRGVTADAYIERQVHELAPKYRITVATSDGLEQLTSMSLGALRMSASMLREDVTKMSGISGT